MLWWVMILVSTVGVQAATDFVDLRTRSKRYSDDVVFVFPMPMMFAGVAGANNSRSGLGSGMQEIVARASSGYVTAQENVEEPAIGMCMIQLNYVVINYVLGGVLKIC